MGKMGEVSKSGRTILFVSHNIGSLSQICTKGLVLNKGKVIFNGQIQNSISNYLNFQKNTIETNWVREKSFLPQNAMIFTNVYLTDNEQQTNEYLIDRDIFLNIEFDIRNKKEKFSVLVTILNNIQMPVFSSEIVIEKEHHILRIKKFTLQQGNYSFKLFLHIPALKCIDSIENCCNFNIIDTQTEWVKYNTHGYDHGNVFGNYIWE
jgi:lipopolysaccharide transport system ATP-binding protein